jgi:hypothetical protein
MQQHLPSLRGTTLLVARGGASEYVQSSFVEACAVALRLGSHGLDVDVVVVAGSVRFVPNNGAGVRSRFRRGGRTGPTITEFFAAISAAADLPVFVRIGADDVGEVVAEVVGEVAAVLTTGDFASSVRPVVGSARGVPGPIPSTSVACYVLGALAEMPHGPERFFAAARSAGWRGVVLPDRDWTGGVVTLAHRFELETVADGVVQEHRAVALLRMGIDVISSSWPDRLASAALEFERTRPTGA